MASAVTHSDQISASCSLDHGSLFVSQKNSFLAQVHPALASGKHWLKPAIAQCWQPGSKAHTLWDQREETSLPSSRESRTDAFLMISVSSSCNFPCRVCCSVQNQNCTSTDQRFQRLSGNVKKKVSGREVITPLLLLVNTVFAASYKLPNIILELW